MIFFMVFYACNLYKKKSISYVSVTYIISHTLSKPTKCEIACSGSH